MHAYFSFSIAQRYDKYLVTADDSIENALKKIDINLRRGLIVIDGNKVVGSITDGDIRKAIIAHRSLRTPVRDVMNTNFVRVLRDEPVDIDAIFHSRGIFLIPVVDNDMTLLDVIVRGA